MSKGVKILVTGGTGYIGAHTVVELDANGYEVVIVDNFSNSTERVLKGISAITGKKHHFIEMDCTDEESMRSLFNEHSEIAAAIHFAALKAVGESVVLPLEYYQNNLLSLIILLKQIVKSERGAGIVFSSSCTVYGQPDPQHLPVDENAPLKLAESPYGRTKQMCEDILSDSAGAYGGKIDAISLRYFNPIGAHPSAHIGELPIGVPQNLLPYVTQTAIGLREVLSIFGDDYNTPDGSCIRDYIYVCDLAKAHVKAIDRIIARRWGGGGEVEYFNLGTGNGVSVFELVNKFMETTGVNVPYRVVGRRVGDIERVWANPSKANSELGWYAATPLEEVLQSAWRWEQKIRKF